MNPLKRTQRVYAYLPDGTEGLFKCLKGFKFLRGEVNKGKTMGFATRYNKKYEIKVTKCSLPNCYCAAQSILIYNK